MKLSPSDAQGWAHLLSLPPSVTSKYVLGFLLAWFAWSVGGFRNLFAAVSAEMPPLAVTILLAASLLFFLFCGGLIVEVGLALVRGVRVLRKWRENATAERHAVASREEAQEQHRDMVTRLLPHLDSIHKEILEYLSQGERRLRDADENVRYLLAWNLINVRLDLRDGRIACELHPTVASTIRAFLAKERQDAMEEAVSKSAAAQVSVLRAFFVEPQEGVPDDFDQRDSSEANRLIAAGVLASEPRESGAPERDLIRLVDAAVNIVERYFGTPVVRRVIDLSPERIRSDTDRGAGVTNNGSFEGTRVNPMPGSPRPFLPPLPSYKAR